MWEIKSEKGWLVISRLCVKMGMFWLLSGVAGGGDWDQEARNWIWKYCTFKVNKTPQKSQRMSSQKHISPKKTCK